MSKEIVVLASGDGSNFESLVSHIQAGHINAKIRCLIADRPCGATQRAKAHAISYYELPRHNDSILNLHVLAMLCHNIDLIVCAGYLSILDPHFVHLFPNKIINIHPSLLPKFGGKGMYGMAVHQAVIAASESESGCTVHIVDAGIDSGPILAQEVVKISVLDDARSLQAKVKEKELRLLPQVVRALLGPRVNL